MVKSAGFQSPFDGCFWVPSEDIQVVRPEQIFLCSPNLSLG